MHEMRGRAGAGKGRGDFAGDMPRFAHTRHDHTALRMQDQVNRCSKAIAQRVTQGREALRLVCDHGFAGGDELGVINHISARKYRFRANPRGQASRALAEN